jgi:hypothetical protein
MTKTCDGSLWRQCRDIIAVEPMLDESKESYSQLFQSLLDRGKTPNCSDFMPYQNSMENAFQKQ